MLIELPNGDWINPDTVQGVQFKDDKQYGPRILIDSCAERAHVCLYMDDAEAARAWIKEFGQKCNAALLVQIGS